MNPIEMTLSNKTQCVPHMVQWKGSSNASLKPVAIHLSTRIITCGDEKGTSCTHDLSRTLCRAVCCCGGPANASEIILSQVRGDVPIIINQHGLAFRHKSLASINISLTLFPSQSAMMLEWPWQVSAWFLSRCWQQLANVKMDGCWNSVIQHNAATDVTDVNRCELLQSNLL